MGMTMGADLLIKCLMEENVRYVFGIPGGQLSSVLDAIWRLGQEGGYAPYDLPGEAQGGD